VIVDSFKTEYIWVIPVASAAKENLENPTTLRENGLVIAGVDNPLG